MMMSTEVEQKSSEEIIESAMEQLSCDEIIETAVIVINRTRSLKQRKEFTEPQSFFLKNHSKDVEELVTLTKKLSKNKDDSDTAKTILKKLLVLKTVLEQVTDKANFQGKKEEVKKSNSLKADLEKVMNEVSPQGKEEINNEKKNSQPFSLKAKLKSLFFCCWGKKESENNNSETIQLLRK